MTPEEKALFDKDVTEVTPADVERMMHILEKGEKDMQQALKDLNAAAAEVAKGAINSAAAEVFDALATDGAKEGANAAILALNEYSKTHKGSVHDFFTDPNLPEVLVRIRDRANDILLELTGNNGKNIFIENKLSRPALLAIPNAGAVNFLLRVMNNVNNNRLPKQSKNNRHEHITAETTTGGKLQFTRETKTGKTIIKINEAAGIIKKTGKTFSKILAFTLQEMARQDFPHDLDVNLQDLVDLGCYSNVNNARRAVLDFFSQQLNIEIGGKITRGRETISESGGIMFYNHDQTKPGFITLTINEKFNWDFVASFFSVLPNFSYSLKGTAFLLVWYIFYLARQNTKEIKDTGTFKIGLESIREYLGMPDVKSVKNRKYKQYIITPIEETIEEIEDKIHTTPEAKGKLTITPYGTETTNILEWLNGYIEVGLHGDFAKTFISIAEKADADRKRWESAKLRERAKLMVISE